MSRKPCDSEYQMHSPCVRLRLLCAVPCEYGGLDDRVVSQVANSDFSFGGNCGKFWKMEGTLRWGVYIR